MTASLVCKKRAPPQKPATSPRSGTGPLHPFAYACLASFPDEGARLRLYSYDPTLETPPGVQLLDARRICPDETLISPLPRQRQALDRHLRRHVPLPDDPRDRVMLGRHRPYLPGIRRTFPRTPTSMADRPTRSARCSSTTRCYGCRASEPALAELVATAEAAVDVDRNGARSARSC